MKRVCVGAGALCVGVWVELCQPVLCSPCHPYLNTSTGRSLDKLKGSESQNHVIRVWKEEVKLKTFFVLWALPAPPVCRCVILHTVNKRILQLFNEKQWSSKLKSQFSETEKNTIICTSGLLSCWNFARLARQQDCRDSTSENVSHIHDIRIVPSSRST